MQLTHLGPYEINKPIGKGGMGSVYAATDTQTGQRVAIKALSPHLAAAEGFRERFEAEIESLKTLRHDGIVRLYGYGEQDGVLFYSMEIVDGISLEDELKAGRRFNWREVTNIAIQLSLALKHAHDHGIVHRDIKPANILLYDDDRVKLADFGIARLFGTTSLTTAGGVLGTADYMSPEQADGRPVTARCDQYSLGGVMYALLAGRPPFRAKNLPQMLQLQRFAEPEPVRRYATDTPEQLEQVLMQLLAKDPAERFPNTQVLARHLQAMVNALSRPAADDFALSLDHLPITGSLSNLHESLAGDATQAEVVPMPHTAGRPGMASSDRTVNPTASQNAATLAADEAQMQQSAAKSATSLAGGAAIAKPLELPKRFTTVEEEERRLRMENQRSWLVILAQLVSLAAVLGVLVAAAMYLSRPATADSLYAKIASRVDGDGDAALGKVENEVSEFLTRFPEDSRASELRSYKDRIELDKLERRLQRQTRGSGPFDATLLPAEQLYLQAAMLNANSPEKSVAMFESLVDLYGADANSNTNDVAERTSDVVVLAKRRIERMRGELAKQREQQLAGLAERMAAAEKLSTNSPNEAVAMYRAILNLYEDEAWAAKVVEAASNRLTELEKK